ncbi:hypothetical protein [Oryzobacter telluris]|uniref:hypothetical protein n=1 Tax=Oryzobacter telluris TaxID=3149179 RepID=UPI00370D237F
MSHRRRIASAIPCVAAAVAVVALGAPQAGAGTPQTTVVETERYFILADHVNNVVAFVNTTRDVACRPEVAAAEAALFAWIQGGEVGDPPEFPATEGAVPIEFSVHELRRGNLVASASTRVPVELWTFEEGKSPQAGNLFGPCFDTDGLVDGTSDPIEPGSMLASGTGTWTYLDNDWSGSGPRSNPFGDRIVASLSGDGGDYSYTVQLKNLVVRGEYARGWDSFRLRAL